MAGKKTVQTFPVQFAQFRRASDTALCFYYVAQSDQKNLLTFLVARSEVFGSLFGIIQFLSQDFFVTNSFHKSLFRNSRQYSLANRMSRSCVRLSPPQSNTTSASPLRPK